MKKYRVTVNGNVYEIELEEIKNGEEAASVAEAPKTKAPESAPVAEPAATAGGERVLSPMPGNILSVNVGEGAAVNKGDVLMVLEAMKMENEIMAPVSGTVSGIVPKGSAVETGTVLCTIK
ncbi:MAG: biotin/lipoyl-binding protein [Clostridia bacterium]|nr:biotin/lipoyl-binding protein [Clostridia bacterium]